MSTPKKPRLACRQPVRKVNYHWGAWKGRSIESQDMPNEMKGIILEASAAIVSLESYAGGKMMFECSGTIIGCEHVNGTYTSTILTSTTLIRSSTDSNAIQDDIEVNVYLPDQKLFKGHVLAYDFHFNIATINITSDVALPIASLRPLDDSLSVYPSEILCPGDSEVASTSFQLRRHSNSFKICPGDEVVALGRYIGATHRLFAALGKFSMDCCSQRFDCRELFRANCIIFQAIPSTLAGHGID